MNEGLEYELCAYALTHDGRAICKLSQSETSEDGKETKGQVVFVPDVLPKQKIIARIIKLKKNYALGELVSILESPSYESLDPCAHADRCGGCSLQKMPYSEQLFWKEKILTDSVQRIAKIESCEINPILPSPNEWEYRNKMEFAFAGKKGELRLGLRVKSSHEVINIEHCKLMPKLAMQVISLVRELANNLGLSSYTVNESEGLGFLRFAIIRIPLSQTARPQCLVHLISSNGDIAEYKKIEQLAEELIEKCSEVTGFVHEIRYSDDYFAIGDKIIFRRGQTVLHEKMNGIDYELGHKSFFQINTVAAEALAKELELSLELSEEAILWDLYAGVGAPCMSLAKKVKKILGIESSAQAVKLANKNAKINNLNNCSYYAGQAHQVMRKLEKPDIVVMDPPRGGVHNSVIDQLLKIKPKQIAYISCDSATLSRDLKLLAKCYAVNRFQPLDFFPQTPHVECIVGLKLK